ncbi:MAG TPA: hypothetical protein VHF51_14105 [Solirubrobacteraceae bacterium]|nr:hypothetical protein [Solirubrobacteraceae bacterium]
MVRLLDAIDRARLTTMDVLLLLHVADVEATVVDLAARLDRRPVDVRRAAAPLVARGLLRRRSDRTVPWGLTFTATVAGLDLLRRVGVQSTVPGAIDGHRRRPKRREPQHRRLVSRADALDGGSADAGSS